jgi:MFS transporter, OPA family, glycerol-3-phosphate transporter
MPTWLSEFWPIYTLLLFISIVMKFVPKIDLGHSAAFRKRRVLNWLPVGLTYAFLYMGRYNLNTLTGVTSLLDKAQFSQIYFWGTLTYGVSFLLNGPLTDRIGGRKTIMLAAGGAALCNFAIAYFVGVFDTQHAASLAAAAASHSTVPYATPKSSVVVLAALYSINMYFQSFGAVSIVKVNSAWFHLKERGTFGAIFGILISLGLYFAFDVCAMIAKAYGPAAAFYVPACILGVFVGIDALFVRDTPGQAGMQDFELGDATEPDRLPPLVPNPAAGYREAAFMPGPAPSANQQWVMNTYALVKKMVTNPAILTITLIEFCSGYLRNSIMQYYKPFTKDLGRAGDFVAGHWGMLLCIAGILGGAVAGLISDHVFQSRRGPVSAVLYGVMVAGALLMFITLDSPIIGWVVVGMSLAIIGVHGMLSGTASMDFAGKKNVGLVVGIIDGFVYLGTAFEALVLGNVLPKGADAHNLALWWRWPAAILPVAIIGFLLTLRVWNATPTKSAAAPH